MPTSRETVPPWKLRLSGNRSDLSVEALDGPVAQAGRDEGKDAVEVTADRSGELLEGREARSGKGPESGAVIDRAEVRPGRAHHGWTSGGSRGRDRRDLLPWRLDYHGAPTQGGGNGGVGGVVVGAVIIAAWPKTSSQ